MLQAMRIYVVRLVCSLPNILTVLISRAFSCSGVHSCSLDTGAQWFTLAVWTPGRNGSLLQSGHRGAMVHSSVWTPGRSGSLLQSGHRGAVVHSCSLDTGAQWFTLAVWTPGRGSIFSLDTGAQWFTLAVWTPGRNGSLLQSGHRGAMVHSCSLDTGAQQSCSLDTGAQWFTLAVWTPGRNGSLLQSGHRGAMVTFSWRQYNPSTTSALLFSH